MSHEPNPPLAHGYRPRSLRELESYLGASDATVEWIEVATRHLVREHAHGGPDHLEHLASAYGVKVNAVPVEHLSARTASVEVLAIAPYVEVFLNEFRREHPRTVRARASDEDLLSYTLDAFGITRQAVGEFEYQVVQYYRLVRNHLMHRIKATQRKEEVEIAFELNRAKLDGYATLSAPNPIQALGFDDFLLFTRALKTLARGFCAAAAPTVAELLAVVAENKRFVSSLRDRSQNKDRMEKRLASYLRTAYGYGTVAEEIATEMVSNGLLAQR